MKIKVYIVFSPPPPEQLPPPPIKELPIVQEEQHVGPPIQRDPGLIYVTCPNPGCDWWGAYDNPSSVGQGIAGHRRKCDQGHVQKARPFGSSGKSVTPKRHTKQQY